MDRCDKWVPGRDGKGTQCVLNKGHFDTGKPEYARCCADTATLIGRINEGKYLDKTAK